MPRSALAPVALSILLLAACDARSNAPSEDPPPIAAMTGGPEDAAPTTTSDETTTTGAEPASTTSDGSTSDDGDLDDEGSTGADVVPQCPSYDGGVESGTISIDALAEASGLAVSRSQPNVVWAHNDSGDDPRLFALSGAGELRAEFVLAGVTPTDWEDIAMGPGPGGDFVYLADIGDNTRSRDEVAVHRVAEPQVDHLPTAPSEIEGAVTFRLRYPDGPHDAETMLIDPVDGALWLVTKETDDPSLVVRFELPATPDAPLEGETVTTLAFGTPLLPGARMTTAGDVSSDGSLVAIRTYTHAFAWRRSAGESLAAAFESEPCPLPLRLELQGEAFGFSPGGASYYTTAEGLGRKLWRYDRGAP